MKVICIDGGGWNDNGVPSDGPETNDICTVLDTYKHETGLHYFLVEYPPTIDSGIFNAKFFRELTSDELEQESLVEQAKEIINEPILIEI